MRKNSKLLLVQMVLIFSCQSTDKNSIYQLTIPEHFPQQINIPDRNPLTHDGVLLGKTLFFDPILSGNGKVSCGTCHRPEFAFTDGKSVSSAGVSHVALIRNTPTILNVAWMDGLFWDGGAKNLESLPFAALTNPDEMGADLSDISQKLNLDPEYRKLFKKAFNIDSISSAFIARALAQYQRTLISSDSKFDLYISNQKILSDEEMSGFQIFNSKCASCHPPPLFTDNLYHNNGLDSIFPQNDLKIRMGRYRISLDSADIGQYKTPTLRNLELTKPYMHDGRFLSLEEVLDHYQNKIIASPTLDSALHDFKISDTEKLKLMAFISTLNDTMTNYDISDN